MFLVMVQKKEQLEDLFTATLHKTPPFREKQQKKATCFVLEFCFAEGHSMSPKKLMVLSKGLCAWVYLQTFGEFKNL